jgi:hypothetical protein
MEEVEVLILSFNTHFLLTSPLTAPATLQAKLTISPEFLLIPVLHIFRMLSRGLKLSTHIFPLFVSY